MSRVLKQFFYGIFYLIVFVAIATGIFFRYVKPAASCFDGIQNQGEQGIDCGGPCANFCTANLAAITSPGAYAFANGPDRVTLLASVVNPNDDFGVVVVPYHFEIFHPKTGANVASIPGSIFVYPNQTRYIVLPNYSVTDYATYPWETDLVVATSGIAWAPSSTMGVAPVFTFSNVVTTSTASGTVTVSGTLGNQEPIALSNVEVDVIFENQYHAPVGATRTVIDSTPASSPVPFSISYPFATADIVPANTIVAAYALRQ